MGQSSSVADRLSRRRRNSNSASTVQPGTDQPIHEQPAVTSDDINTIGTVTGIQPKNENIEECSYTTQRDVLQSAAPQADSNRSEALSSSDNETYQHTSDRPQRTYTPSPSHLMTTSSGPAASTSSSPIDSSSLANTKTLAASAQQEEDTSSANSSGISTRSRGFLSKLRSRRLSRRTSSSQTISEEADNTAMQIPIPSTSKLTLEDTMKDHEPEEDAHVPLQMPMTPPEEEDAMFEERQRARRMIEASLMSAGSDLHRPLPSARSSGTFPSSTVPMPFGPAAAVTLPPHTPTPEGSGHVHANPPIYSPSHSSTSHNSIAPTSDNTQSTPQTPDRLYAVLPRRSRSNSPVPSSRSVPASAVPVGTAEQQTSTPVASPTTSGDSSTQASLALPGLTRHIMVQGLVTQAPPPRSPTRTRMSLLPDTSSTRERVPSAASQSQSNQEDDTMMNSDSGFWDELPGSDSMDLDVDEAEEDSEDEDWQSTVSQLLNLRRDSPAGRRRSGSDPSENEEDGIEGQANLIGRLLRVAAAATAATLLPGGLVVDGEVVPGFDDSGPLGAPVGRGRSSPRQQTSRADTSNTTSQASTDNGSTLVGTDNGTAPAVESMNGNGAAPVQTSNRVADSVNLSAPEASAATSEAAGASESPQQSALPVFPPASPLTETPSAGTCDPIAPLGPSSEPSRSEPSSTAMDISPPPSPSATLAQTPESMLASPTSTASPYLTRPDDAIGAGRSLLPGMLSLRASSGSLAAEGTFDRFLADLQRDVSSAIRSSVNRENGTPSPQSTTEQAVPSSSAEGVSNTSSTITAQQPPPSTTETPATRPFSFFRAYRFPSRSIPAAGGIPALSNHSSTVSIPTTAARPVPSEPVSSTDDMQINQPTSQTAAAPPAATTAAPSIVPMLFVGVRSAASSMLEDLPSSFGAASSGSRQERSGSRAVPEDLPGGSEMRDASNQTPSSGSTPERSEPASDEPRVQGFVLWIFGGLYPPTHPVVLAPSLLGDEAMSYEEMMRLADMIGQHKPPTVSKQEIAEAGLKMIKGSQVKTAEADGNIRSVTADKCLICLEDYEAEEDVRVLNCLHCFHQGCVDRWLSDGANTCPACRKAGVEKEQSPATQAEQVPGQVNTTAETMTTAQEVPLTM